MTPVDFQTIALSWISALVVVVVALAAAYARIAPLISDLKSAHAANDKAIGLTAQQTDQNTARLNGQSAKIDDLQKALPPTGASPANTVNAPTADTVIVNEQPAAPPTPAPFTLPASPAPDLSASPAPDLSASPGGTVIPVLAGGFPGVAPTPSPATVNITILPGAAFDAATTAAAHAAIDAAAANAATEQDALPPAIDRLAGSADPAPAASSASQE